MLKMKKVLVFESSLFTPHTETGLELYISNKSQGNNTKYVPLYEILTLIETHLFIDPTFSKNRCRYATEQIKDVIDQDDIFLPQCEGIKAKIQSL